MLITGLKNHADPLAGGVADISNAAGTRRPICWPTTARCCTSTVGYLEAIQQPLIDQKDQLERPPAQGCRPR